eukprot:GHVH01006221.1.p1 GENE.GHVH01006221.1~~GHVH01006221.1.p1  ORF type:complete len:557 (-),score=49.55 GHVH01006221.1:2239-3909(-)
MSQKSFDKTLLTSPASFSSLGDRSVQNGSAMRLPPPDPLLTVRTPSDEEEDYDRSPVTLRSVLLPILFHCILCYLQSCFGEITYRVVGDVATVLLMQAAISVMLCPVMSHLPILHNFYPSHYLLPVKYLKMLFIPNFAFAFQLLFKQIAIQKAGVGFGEIISGFSVLMAAWLQYVVLGITLYGWPGFIALAFYGLSLFSAYFKVGISGLGIGLVQGSCSSIRTIFTRRVNERIIIKPGHHQFFTGVMNLLVMGVVSLYRHLNHTFIDAETGEQFLPITRIFYMCSIRQFVAAFTDNVLVFYLMSLMAPLSYHLQSQVESLSTTTLDFAGLTEYLGGSHKSFDNTPTMCAYFFRLFGVAFYSYSKLMTHLAQKSMLKETYSESPYAENNISELSEIVVTEIVELVDVASICTETSHGVFFSLEQRQESMKRTLLVRGSHSLSPTRLQDNMFSASSAKSSSDLINLRPRFFSNLFSQSLTTPFLKSLTLENESLENRGCTTKTEHERGYSFGLQPRAVPASIVKPGMRKTSTFVHTDYVQYMATSDLSDGLSSKKMFC